MMFRYNVVLLHIMIFIMAVSGSLYDSYFIYMVIKMIFLSIDIILNLVIPSENYKVKYTSLVIYFVFSISGVVLCIHIVVSDQM